MQSKTIIHLHDKSFRPAYSHKQISEAIARVATQINADYAGKECPLFLGILNGSFMFMGELMQHIDLACEVSFIKMASYNGTKSMGDINDLIGLTDNIKGRNIIIVEDIVDTGNSYEHILQLLEAHAPASIAIATLLFKPEAYTKTYPVAYCAMEIPDKFIIGFGLDYDGLGRNYKDIYELAE